MRRFVAALLFLTLNSFAAPAIIDGRAAKKNQFPWQVSLQNKYKGHFCSGAIISPYFIVTAAHCFEEEKLENIRIRGGRRSNLKSLDDLPLGEKVHIHPNFKVDGTRLLGADLALIKLRAPIEFTKNIRPIEMINDSIVTDETQIFTENLFASGWGQTWAGSFSDPLRYITNLTMLPKVQSPFWLSNNLEELASIGRNSNQEWIQLAFDTGDYLALQGHRRGTICHGDSGGPLTLIKNGKSYLAGVAAHVSHRICVQSKVFFYTDLFKFKSWVDTFI